MKPNVLIALLVGCVMGFAVGKAVTAPAQPGPSTDAVVAAAPSPRGAGGPAPARADNEPVYKVPVGSSPAKGPATALVTVVEFSDYQCPFCSRADATVNQLLRDYGDKVRVVMKQQPLSFHDRARPAALAALAAGEQNKYWEMHAKLFANQQGLSDADLERYAGEIGLNVARWKADLQSPKLAGMVDADQTLGNQIGASGTPTFFINGKQLVGAQPVETFKSKIDAELAYAESLVRAGTGRAQVYERIIENGATQAVQGGGDQGGGGGGGCGAPSGGGGGCGAPGGGGGCGAPGGGGGCGAPGGGGGCGAPGGGGGGCGAPGGGCGAPSGNAPAAQVFKVDVPSDSPARGPKGAKVTVVVWSDFQCPFCSRAVPTLKELERSYGKDLRVVFRHQPLSFHDKAKGAAVASMAAHEQGKFWEMHDKLFENQQGLGDDTYLRLARELGLNEARFKAALANPKYAQLVDRDASEGSKVGADGTPTFFVNGRQLVGAQPVDQFKAMIDEEMKKADKLLAAGTKPDQLYAKINADNVAAAPAAPAAPQGGGAPAPAAVQNIEVGKAPVKGDKNAPVTIVAYSDFQCPFCSRVLPTLKELEQAYGKKIRVAFKNQPLPFHENARPAAAAALAAHEQGKFWEMHDKLFANQQALDRASLLRYAKELGLNEAKFTAALDSQKLKDQIDADQAEAGRVGANGTPTFFINGRQLVGAQPTAEFKKLIDEELAKKK
jgi:protein-disulfide isomerase